jgi:hypothetical protein
MASARLLAVMFGAGCGMLVSAWLAFAFDFRAPQEIRAPQPGLAIVAATPKAKEQQGSHQDELPGLYLGSPIAR